LLKATASGGFFRFIFAFATPHAAHAAESEPTKKRPDQPGVFLARSRPRTDAMASLTGKPCRGPRAHRPSRHRPRSCMSPAWSCHTTRRPGSGRPSTRS